MKKFKLFSILIMLVIFSGCKTLPLYEDINPLDLLDGSSAFYIKVPADIDRQLVEKVLMNNVRGLSQSDVQKISHRISTVYMGISRTRTSVDYQIAASCNLIHNVLPRFFNKKNGWNENTYSYKNILEKSVKYRSYTNSGIEIAFPSSSIACLGRNVPDMLLNFHQLNEKLPLEKKNYLSSDVYDFFDTDENEIRFFAVRPGRFLGILVGTDLNLKLSYARGKMVTDSKTDSQYIMDLEFEFLDRRLVPAARAALSLAFGLTDSSVSIDKPEHLTIRNIKIDKKQLYKLLTL